MKKIDTEKIAQRVKEALGALRQLLGIVERLTALFERLRGGEE